jgi:hypothetical protein
VTRRQTTKASPLLVIPAKLVLRESGGAGIHGDENGPLRFRGNHWCFENVCGIRELRIVEGSKKWHL